MTGVGEGKPAIILLSMGGPERLTDVRKFLFNIFSDRALIRLPGGALLQKPFAFLISALRSKKVQARYEQIGGRSPLLKWSRMQAAQVEEQLRREIAGVRCYVGMQYFTPTVREAILKAYADGCRQFCFLPLYPQFSTATTGSSFATAARTIARLKGVSTVFVKDFHDDEGYVRLLREYISANIREDETLLFSAHSLPQKFVDDGDPYVGQVRRTAALSAGGREYFVSFQSRTGPVRWVGPDTIDESRRLLERKSGGLFVVPVSFVCDHIETLYEIDIELPKLVGNDAAGRIRRMPMFNGDQRFTKVLASIARSRIVNYVKA